MCTYFFTCTINQQLHWGVICHKWRSKFSDFYSQITIKVTTYLSWHITKMHICCDLRAYKIWKLWSSYDTWIRISWRFQHFTLWWFDQQSKVEVFRFLMLMLPQLVRYFANQIDCWFIVHCQIVTCSFGFEQHNWSSTIYSLHITIIRFKLVWKLCQMTMWIRYAIFTE